MFQNLVMILERRLILIHVTKRWRTIRSLVWRQAAGHPKSHFHVKSGSRQLAGAGPPHIVEMVFALTLLGHKTKSPAKLGHYLGLAMLSPGRPAGLNKDTIVLRLTGMRSKKAMPASVKWAPKSLLPFVCSLGTKSTPFPY
jgi:hypothetical protein